MNVRRRIWIPAAVVALTAVIVVFAAFYYDNQRDAPPVVGSMQNFIVADKPVPAPAVSVIARDGSRVTLDRYRGKLVVLNFWATWCAPCVRELPSLQRLSRRLSDDGVVILISQDRGGFERVTPFLDKLNIDIADSFVDDRRGYSRAIIVQSLPTTVVMGRDGRELGRLVGPAEWDSPEALALIDYYLAR